MLHGKAGSWALLWADKQSYTQTASKRREKNQQKQYIWKINWRWYRNIRVWLVSEEQRSTCSIIHRESGKRGSFGASFNQDTSESSI